MGSSSVAITIASTLLFLVALGLTSFRVYESHYPGPGIEGNRDLGFCDFYNGIYYPTQAFWNQDNPYGKEVVETYPVSRQVPFFSPLVFLLHAPFALLPKAIGAVSFFAFLVLLVIALVRLTIQVLDVEYRPWLLMLIAGCLLLSRPGQNSIFNGYFTLELVVGAVLALHFGKSKPWVATIGLVIASVKPTYAIPIFILMLCRGHWKPAISGAAIASLFAVGGLFWISDSQSFSEITGIVSAAQESHQAFPNIWPVNTWTRVDLLAIVAKWNAWRPSGDFHLIAMLCVLIIPCVTVMLAKNLQKKANNFDDVVENGAGGLIGLICLLAVLVSIYHHFYDCLLLCVPLVGLMMARKTYFGRFAASHRYVLIVLLSVPFVNYFSAHGVINALGIEGDMFTLVTSVNGICLAAAMFYACAMVLTAKRQAVAVHDAQS